MQFQPTLKFAPNVWMWAKGQEEQVEKLLRLFSLFSFSRPFLPIQMRN